MLQFGERKSFSGLDILRVMYYSLCGNINHCGLFNFKANFAEGQQILVNHSQGIKVFHIKNVILRLEFEPVNL